MRDDELHRILKARATATIKTFALAHAEWRSIETNLKTAPEDEQYLFIGKWVRGGKGHFRESYETLYGKLPFDHAMHIAKWLVEELNEGL